MYYKNIPIFTKSFLFTILKGVDYMKTKIDIFSGFLGAGKTVLIKKLISEKLYNDKIVIIENEFGEVGIDGTILKKSNIQVKEINAGCICCTVTGNFNDSIKEVIEKYSPERIIIEPSGVAKLSEILDICKKHELKDILSINMIITVVDVLRFNMYITNFNDFYKNQIVNAKTIILTRTENLSPENLLKTVEKIKQINSKAAIISTNWSNLPATKIIKVAEKDLYSPQFKSFTLLKPTTNKISVKHKIKNITNETFESFGIETPKLFPKETLNVILHKLENSNYYGTILRAKGIVQVNEKEWLQFDYVPEELNIKTSSPDYTGKICVIGTNLNKLALENLFLS
ncbi:GTP-binding protein [Clostridium tetani]|uniref:GTP-binding protein n=2 Tax=Clostridium tetani TaxID=1513 RepID=A0ABY0ENT4_CLOTA|nr:GTP-binding protein [Clostridium tetani]RXI68436.1 GTP-binding protein [Clostridium tetani]